MLVIAIVILSIGLVSSQSYHCGDPQVQCPDVGRIVGGWDATYGCHPWLGSLRLNGNHICGGSLLNEEWFITAGHCVNPLQNPAVYTVSLGRQFRLTTSQYTITRQVASVVRHESYDGRFIRHDIALLRLSAPVQYNDYILPICFPAVTDTYEGDISRASGWGTLVSGGSLPNILQEVDMEVLTDALCDSRFSGTSGINDMLDPSRQVCAGHIGENKDTCQGDSGGPLAVQHADGYWYLIGLTSWGYGCGDGGVYTRVSAYRSWVEARTGPL